MIVAEEAAASLSDEPTAFSDDAISARGEAPMVALADDRTANSGAAEDSDGTADRGDRAVGASVASAVSIDSPPAAESASEAGGRLGSNDLRSVQGGARDGQETRPQQVLDSDP